VNIIVKDTECPEAHRYDKIIVGFGNRPELSQLGLVCDMLKISPTACDGCPYKPEGAVLGPREVVKRSSPGG